MKNFFYIVNFIYKKKFPDMAFSDETADSCSTLSETSIHSQEKYNYKVKNGTQTLSIVSSSTEKRRKGILWLPLN